jgi:hypothetical protein
MPDNEIGAFAPADAWARLPRVPGERASLRPPGPDEPSPNYPASRSPETPLITGINAGSREWPSAQAEHHCQATRAGN